MQQNKDIDRLFQEKFKDFEIQPDLKIWKSIENNLSQQKKHKPITIWYRAVSIVAILTILFSSGNYFLTKQQNIKIDNNVVKNPINKNAIKDNIEPENKKIINKLINLNEGKIAKSKNIKSVKIRQTVSSITKNNSTKNFAIVQNKVSVKDKIQTNFKNKLEETNKTNNTNIAISKIDYKQYKDKYSIKNNELVDKAIQIDTNKTNVKSVLLENEIAKKIDVKDEIIADIEEEKKKKIKKYSIGTSYAPIYYSSLSNGSSIDESIANNSNSTNYSSSYGMKFEYKINNKWSIQTGINKVNLSNSTKGVNVNIVNETSTTVQFSNIQLTNAGNSINVNLSENRFISTALPIASLEGSLKQSVGYIEMPINIKYNIYDKKKVNMQFSSGFSTLFLNKNKVLLDNNIGTYDLGSATNLNKTNFSANLGVDFSYNFSENWFINLSPSFKYQLNTYSENSGGVKPYLININTGLNFRF